MASSVVRGLYLTEQHKNITFVKNPGEFSEAKVWSLRRSSIGGHGFIE